MVRASRAFEHEAHVRLHLLILGDLQAAMGWGVLVLNLWPPPWAAVGPIWARDGVVCT